MQRYELVEKILLPEANISQLCQQYGVSRKTAYKWLARFQEGGFAALSDESRARKKQHLKVPDDIEEAVVKAHKKYPYWGPKKLLSYLENQNPSKLWPADSTIARILARNNCAVIRNNKSKPATKRFERERPNALWQMDFKGSFMTSAHRCHPLTIIDDYSRYSIALEACKNEAGETVKARLIKCFHEFGLPDQINVDNGSPWGSSGSAQYTWLVVWLIKCGVKVTHSAPYHPQTNGKDERFHRTLKLEVLHQKQYKSCFDIQIYFNEWRHTYNHIRPHHALNGKTPSSRYNVSDRDFKEPPRVVEYDKDATVRKVCSVSGLMRFKGRRFNVGKALAGEYVELKETSSPDIYSLYFMDSLIKKINLERGLV